VFKAGEVNTLAGNGETGFADGQGEAARFDHPVGVALADKEGTIVVADMRKRCLRKILGREVTTLAGGSEALGADGAGACARFHEPIALALDERGRLLVVEYDRADTLRVVDASLSPPAWYAFCIDFCFVFYCLVCFCGSDREREPERERERERKRKRGGESDRQTLR